MLGGPESVRVALNSISKNAVNSLPVIGALVIAIALATPVLGGPESVRVVLNSSSRILPPSRV